MHFLILLFRLFFQTHTLQWASSYPVCIECLHACDHTILHWRCAVAALAGGEQEKSLPGSIFSYRWDAVSSEGMTEEVMHLSLVRGSGI